jgi:hypothetical protein
LLAGANDETSALDAINKAAAALSDKEKLEPATADLLALYSETATSNATAQNVEGNSVTISSNSDLNKDAGSISSKADQALSSAGVESFRQIRQEIKYILKDATDEVAIILDASASSLTTDKIRVEAPFASIVLSKAFIESAVFDGAAYQLAVGKSGGEISLKYESNKPVDGKFGLSVPASKDIGGVVVNKDGKQTPIKHNPAVKADEWTVNAKSTTGSFSRKALTISFTDLGGLNKTLSDSINYLAQRGIIAGTSETAFSPKGSLTRAQLTQMIVSINELDASADGNFTDIGANDWMRAGVGSGKKIGIISGNPNGTFEPNKPISKDQIVAISARTLALEMPMLKSANASSLGAFSDSSSIADWAKADIASAKEAGLFALNTSGKFRPETSMSRQDAAFIIKNLFDRIWL